SQAFSQSRTVIRLGSTCSPLSMVCSSRLSSFSACLRVPRTVVVIVFRLPVAGSVPTLVTQLVGSRRALPDMAGPPHDLLLYICGGRSAWLQIPGKVGVGDRGTPGARAPVLPA